MHNEPHLLNFLNPDLIEAGCDEAGRGPLAGPVYAAAVILPQGLVIEGLNDSKKLSEKNEIYIQKNSLANVAVYITDDFSTR